ncbi:hypothetical protein [Phreatobacter oligotrophus]|uniref:hypothetical protein n=1 Tax=Phreatobacter oligotrophus TaxID=1122261 RepID=UPI0023539664|nr:hypothetical protein [Phreatobacter oligotrophus]MBX9993084.1 hypothetical protein [Phreatobacter oligotrophus]
MNPPLPNRPLKVMLPKPPSRIGAFFLFLGAMVLAGGIAWLSVPGLVRDAAILGNAEPATQARFVSGRCKSKLVLHFCDITYNRRGPQGTVREESHVGFFELHVGSRSVSLLQKRGDPSLVTSDIALDHYWNRVVTAGLFILLFGGGGLVALGQALRPRRDPHAPFRALSGRLMGPVLVDMTGSEATDKASWSWHYAPRSAGPALGQGFTLTLPAGAYPFMLDRDGRTALAVTDAAGHAILLLDEALSVIDLTDGERGALFGWRQAMWAPRAAEPALATAGG